MKLPNRAQAFIPEAKLDSYLLSPTHPEGSPKAGFFKSVGYDRSNAETLRSELFRIASEDEIMQEISSPYGKKYIIEGMLRRAGGNGIPLRTVWIINNGESAPNFVTAYPLS